jgi:outer membrane lipoprotein-sorting protein
MSEFAWRALLAAGTLVALCHPVGADDARALLQQAETRHQTRSQQYTGEMTIVTKEGKSWRATWKSFREGYAGDTKELLRFVSPPEIKGVAFLSLGQAGKTPEQWIYLPSMKRERRIAARDRDEPFIGSDFTFEDMEAFDHRKFDVEAKGEQTLAGQPCYVIEARPNPKAGKSLYERRVLYLLKDDLYPLQVDLFRKGEKEPSKRLLLSDLQKVEGHWLAEKMEMSDLKKGSRTTVLVKDTAFDLPQPPGRFTLQNLTREGGED